MSAPTWRSSLPTLKKAWMAVPAVAVSCADFAVTLAGQPAAYWGDPSRHNEANPLSALMLGYGPAAYLLSKLIYLLLITVVVWLLPRLFSLTAAMALTVGHAFGLLTWLLYDSGLNFHWVYLFFPALAGLLVWQAWYFFRCLEVPAGGGAGSAARAPTVSD